MATFSCPSAKENDLGEGTTMDFAALIARVQRLLLSPATEWDTIAGEAADVQKIYMNYVGPLLIASAIAGAISLMFFGFGFGATLQQLLTQIVLGLIGVYVVAFVTNALAPTFGATPDMGQAFKLAAYAPTAAWVGGIFVIVPMIGSIVAIVGALYSLYLLYVGLPKLMRPPEDKVVIYILAIIGVMVVIFLAIGFISSSMLPSMTPMIRNY
jgi:hypothetical protein